MFLHHLAVNQGWWKLWSDWTHSIWVVLPYEDHYSRFGHSSYKDKTDLTFIMQITILLGDILYSPGFRLNSLWKVYQCLSNNISFEIHMLSKILNCMKILNSRWPRKYLSLATMIYLCTIQDAHHINISIRNALRIERFLNASGYVVLRQSDKSGLAEPVGQYNDSDRVSFLDWCVIWVQVLQESLEGFMCCVRDGDLKTHENWNVLVEKTSVSDKKQPVVDFVISHYLKRFLRNEAKDYLSWHHSLNVTKILI